MRSNPIATIYLDKRNQLKDGTYPVTLRIYFENKAKFYRIRGEKNNVPGLTEEEFKKAYSRKTTPKLKEYKRIFDDIQEAANDTIASLDYFSFDLFKEKFFNPVKINKTENNFFQYLINEISLNKKNNKYSSASIYSSIKMHLESFCNRNHLLFQEITPSFLNKLETWLIEVRGIQSVNTIGIYMRNIRVLYNKAINDNIVKKELYPFGKSKYQIPKLTKKTIKALTKDEVHLLNEYETVDESMQMGRDMWIFSYLSNGMNIADIVRIKYADICDGGFEFIRKKTEDTAKSNLKSINVAIQPRMQEIINKWGNTPDKKYIFPFIDEEMDEEKIQLKINNLNQFITKKIKLIAKDCGIDKEVSAVYARHSFATILRDSGAPIEYISEALGHNSVTTTMHYLAKFNTGTVKKWSAELL